MIRFTLDKVKANLNIQKHKVSFEEAITVFFDPLSASFDDPDHSSAREQRYLTVGFSEHGRLLIVSHAEQSGIIRIISARKATAHERKHHEEETGRAY